MKRKHVFTKMIAIAALAAATMATNLTANAATFGDVHSGDWFYNSVNYVAENGIMTGYEDGTFGPSHNLTRGQFATTLYRISGSPEIEYDGRFPDVAGNVFYAKASTWASQNNIVTGYENGNFGGNDNITREQVATILYRYAPSAGKDNTVGDYSGFPDAGRVSNFAKDGIGYAINAGIISGDQGNINPHGKANRAQCATILYRFLTSEDAGETPHEHTWQSVIINPGKPEQYVPETVTVDYMNCECGNLAKDCESRAKGELGHRKVSYMQCECGLPVEDGHTDDYDGGQGHDRGWVVTEFMKGDHNIPAVPPTYQNQCACGAVQ